MESIGKLLTLITFSCIPITLFIGFITTNEYRNIPVFVALLFFTYIGVYIWINANKK